jgi:thymidylate synthase (FAD)
VDPSVVMLAATLPLAGAVDLGIAGPEELIEYAGRVDYGRKSLDKMGDPDIIQRWIKSGHESMVEMVDAAFLITCSRVVSHELVRHRIASFQQESQRYVRYDEEEPEDLFILPPELDPTERFIAEEACYEALRAYKKLKVLGVKSQFARYLLPNATRTRIVMKANLREWRHFLRLRMHSSAQPEMQIIANLIHDELLACFPEVFSDIKPWLEEGERAAR